MYSDVAYQGSATRDRTATLFGQTMGLWIPPIFRAEVHFESRLVAPRLIETIHRERISVLAAVPRVFALLKTHLETAHSQLPNRIDASKGIRAWKRWWRFRRVEMPPESRPFQNAIAQRRAAEQLRRPGRRRPDSLCHEKHRRTHYSGERRGDLESTTKYAGRGGSCTRHLRPIHHCRQRARDAARQPGDPGNHR